MKWRTMRNSRGITAVEVALTVLLLALGVIPVVNMVLSTSREAGFTEAHALAQARAFTLLDCQEALGFSALPRAAEPMELPIPRSAPPRQPAPGAYTEVLGYRELEDGLGMLSISIRWTLATDKPGTRQHEYRAIRMICRPDASWTQGNPLPLAANREVAD